MMEIAKWILVTPVSHVWRRNIILEVLSSPKFKLKKLFLKVQTL